MNTTATTWHPRRLTPQEQQAEAQTMALALNTCPPKTGQHHHQAQILVLSRLLMLALPVLKNADAENSDEDAQLGSLITETEAALRAVLTEHAMPHRTTPT